MPLGGVRGGVREPAELLGGLDSLQSRAEELNVRTTCGKKFRQGPCKNKEKAKENEPARSCLQKMLSPEERSSSDEDIALGSPPGASAIQLFIFEGRKAPADRRKGWVHRCNFAVEQKKTAGVAEICE